MPHLLVRAAAGLSFAIVPIASAQSWVTFNNQTSSRIVAAPGLSTTDPEEKDYTWGDYDHDGDTDLVVVRKSPFSTIGRKRNVLFMNEGIAEGHGVDGVLVDRTSQYATAATDGGQGFLDLTDDRDVISVDVNNDGWLDLVTATTYGQGLAKTISHPRIYMNLGEVAGVWQGFRYEESRFPNLGSAPNFCGVGAGDVTGDKAPDLYFVDYDSATSSTYDDRLLVNDGAGFFTDQSATRMTPAMLGSSFGNTANIADMNGDGRLDVVKNENGPATILYNGPNGIFNAMQLVYSGTSYFASVNDLNGDGKLDLVLSDDGIDRYLINTGNAQSGQANFTSYTFPSVSGGFGSSSRYADLNRDGKVDVLIADVDVDIPGCDRQLNIYRNLGTVPAFSQSDNGTAGIPANMRTGTYDVAPIDLNGDQWPDLVIGRCSSMSVWMNVPPSGLSFSYPQGMPAFVASQVETSFQMQVSSIGSVTPVDGTGTFHYSINGSPYTSVAMASHGGNLYTASFPSSQCTDIVTFYVSAQASNSQTYRDPANAPASTFSAVSAQGTEITMEDGFEGKTAGWSVVNQASAGAWQTANPNGTINGGVLAAPEDDNGNGEDVTAFITQDGSPGGPAAATDVDGGPTALLSPILDLAATDATISYDRWFYCEDADTAEADFLKTEISNNGGSSWVLVHQTGGTGSAWESVSFRVGQYVTPSAQVRVRFSTMDLPNNSVTEAGIDNFTIEELVCAAPCAADIAPAGGDGAVNVSDLLAVISAWGASGGDGPADINDDGTVNVSDLLMVIAAWGPCP